MGLKKNRLETDWICTIFFMHDIFKHEVSICRLTYRQLCKVQQTVTGDIYKGNIPSVKTS